jgi:hypothetical protein
MGLLARAPLGVVCATARCEEWTSAAMEDECFFGSAIRIRASVERHTSKKSLSRIPVDAVA